MKAQLFSTSGCPSEFRRNPGWKAVGTVFAALYLAVTFDANAEPIAGSVRFVAGTVTASKGEGAPFTKVELESKITAGAIVRTGPESETLLLLAPGCALATGPSTEVTVEALDLETGAGTTRRISVNVARGKAAIILERYFSGRSDIRLNTKRGGCALGSCGFVAAEAGENSSMFVAGGKHQWMEGTTSVEMPDETFLLRREPGAPGVAKPIVSDPTAQEFFDFGSAAVLLSVTAKTIDPGSCPVLAKLGIAAGPGEGVAGPGQAASGFPFNPAAGRIALPSGQAPGQTAPGVVDPVLGLVPNITNFQGLDVSPSQLP